VLNLLNPLFMMCISFLPLPTEILATYLHKGFDARVAVTFYTIGLVLLSVSWTLMWLHANRGIGWSINGSRTTSCVS
jgi:uncharacterized membrane protein